MNKVPPSLFFLALAVWLADYMAQYEIAHTPVPAQVAVIDLDGLVKEAVALDPNDKEAMEKLTGKLKDTAARLAAKGVVVLDAKAVLHAPEEAYVRFQD